MGIEILVLIFTALSVFFLASVIVVVLGRAFERYQNEYVSKHASDLSEMFVFVGREQLIILTLAASAMLSILALLLFGPIAAVLFFVAGFLTPAMVVRFYRRRRVLLFERQLVDALSTWSAGLRAGLSLRQAMEEIQKTSPSPLADEFALTLREMRLGGQLDAVLKNLAGRVQSEDLWLVVNGISTARSVGGNISELFESLANTIRERFKIEGKVRSLTAQGRLQGLIVGAMPFLVWLAFDAIRPDLTRPMMSHWFGYGVFTLVLLMEFLGALVIRRLITIRV